MQKLGDGVLGERTQPGVLLNMGGTDTLVEDGQQPAGFWTHPTVDGRNPAPP